jgi:hypothetical protein
MRMIVVDYDALFRGDLLNDGTLRLEGTIMCIEFEFVDLN